MEFIANINVSILNQLDSSAEMKKYLVEVNDKCERNSKYSIKYSVYGYVCYMIITAVLNVPYCYLKIGCMETNCLYYPAKFTCVNHIFVKNRI